MILLPTSKQQEEGDQLIEDTPSLEESSTGSPDVSQQNNLNIENNLEEITAEEPVSLSAEELAADRKLQEFFNEYMPEKAQQRVFDAGSNLEEMAKATEEMGLVLLNPVDINNMTQGEKEKFRGRLEFKTKLYNVVKTVGINLYQVETKSFLKKMKKARDSLEKNLISYQEQLKGVGYNGKSNDVNSMLYSQVFENMPEEVKKNPKYSSIIDHINHNQHSSNGKSGLKNQLRDLKKRGRFYLEIDDALVETIAQYKKNLREISEDIKQTNIKLTKSPGDESLMRLRQRKSAKYDDSEDEIAKYSDVREEISEMLEDIRFEYNLAKSDKNMKEVAVQKTKNTLKHLNQTIRETEKYIQGNDDMIGIYGNLMLVSQAEELVNTGIVFAGGMSTVVDKVYGEMVKKELEQGPNISMGKPNSEWESLADSYKNKREEMLEETKSSFRDELFS